ncbi:MAG: PilZ domain-containing protein [Deltaproteobacteria bacterium]|jgi:c-di-GMP-binding flagellar brake protein YcgR|nr:PilZ domain-containing protein [Deltaproteobacteria bacterium]MBT4527932.1 PilZ domain-containing protein [Deltaproteobacteria bacterium]
MDNQRKAKRFMIHQMIEISFGKEEFMACEGLNLSETGMLCKMNTEVEFHSRFYLLFEVPIESEMMEITCEAQMVHYKKVEEGWEVGISFHDIKPSIQMILKKYIQSLEIK